MSVPNREEAIAKFESNCAAPEGCNGVASFTEGFDAGWNAHASAQPSEGEEKVDGGNSADRSGSNYTADDDTFPTEVYFANGRKVGIAFDGDKPYLTVSAIERGSYENKSK